MNKKREDRQHNKEDVFFFGSCRSMHGYILTYSKESFTAFTSPATGDHNFSVRTTLLRENQPKLNRPVETLISAFAVPRYGKISRN